MEFKLKLIPELPNQYVLNAEKKLSGMKLLEEAAKCLRRNLDSAQRCSHQTMGAVYSYEISVPQQVAVESEYFNNSATRYMVCDAGILNQFIFHAANFTYGSGNRNYYPYYQNELVVTSFIDELGFIDLWRRRGYPEKMVTAMEPGTDIPLVPDADDVDNPIVGDVVFDDLTMGDT